MDEQPVVDEQTEEDAPIKVDPEVVKKPARRAPVGGPVFERGEDGKLVDTNK